MWGIHVGHSEEEVVEKERAKTLGTLERSGEDFAQRLYCVACLVFIPGDVSKQTLNAE